MERANDTIGRHAANRNAHSRATPGGRAGWPLARTSFVPVASCRQDTHARTLLVVDDMPSATLVVRELSSCGRHVFHATDIAAAKDIAARERPEAAVLELRLGSSSAMELLPLIRATSPETRIVISTAFPCVSSARWAIQAGASAYLTKPVTARQILAALTNMDEEEAPSGWPPLDFVRREYIREVVTHCGSIAAASRVLNVERRSLRRMMTRLGLDRNELLGDAGEPAENET